MCPLLLTCLMGAIPYLPLNNLLLILGSASKSEMAFYCSYQCPFNLDVMQTRVSVTMDRAKYSREHMQQNYLQNVIHVTDCVAI